MSKTGSAAGAAAPKQYRKDKQGMGDGTYPKTTELNTTHLKPTQLISTQFNSTQLSPTQHHSDSFISTYPKLTEPNPIQPHITPLRLVISDPAGGAAKKCRNGAAGAEKLRKIASQAPKN